MPVIHYEGSSASITEVVNVVGMTATSVVSSRDPSVVNEPVTFTATVMGNAPPPGVVQSAFYRAGYFNTDAVLGLPNYPTEGNTLIFMQAGSSIGTIFPPAGLVQQVVFSSGGQRSTVWTRVAQPGDGTTWTFSLASQAGNQDFALLELQGTPTLTITAGNSLPTNLTNLTSNTFSLSGSAMGLCLFEWDDEATMSGFFPSGSAELYAYSGIGTISPPIPHLVQSKFLRVETTPYGGQAFSMALPNPPTPGNTLIWVCAGQDNGVGMGPSSGQNPWTGVFGGFSYTGIPSNHQQAWGTRQLVKAGDPQAVSGTTVGPISLAVFEVSGDATSIGTTNVWETAQSQGTSPSTGVIDLPGQSLAIGAMAWKDTTQMTGFGPSPPYTAVYSSDGDPAGQNALFFVGAGNPLPDSAVGGTIPNSAIYSYAWLVLPDYNFLTEQNHNGVLLYCLFLSSVDSVFTGTLSGRTTSGGGAYCSVISQQSGIPTGTVTFTDNNISMGSPVTLVGEVAAFGPISSLSQGSHTIKATYSGDLIYQGSSGSLIQNVIIGTNGLLADVPGFALAASYSPAGDEGLPAVANFSIVPPTAAPSTPIYLLWTSVNVATVHIFGTGFDTGVLATSGSGLYEVAEGFLNSVVLNFYGYDSNGVLVASQSQQLTIT